MRNSPDVAGSSWRLGAHRAVGSRHRKDLKGRDCAAAGFGPEMGDFTDFGEISMNARELVDPPNHWGATLRNVIFCGLNMARNLGSNPSALWRSGSAPWFGARGGTDEGIGNGWFLYGFYTDPKMSFKSRYPQQTIESTMNQPKNEENVSRYLKEHWIQN